METAPDSTPIWLPFAVIQSFCVVFPSFWCGVVWLISRIGDWGRLARIYAAGKRPVSGTQTNSVLGMVGLANYRHTLTLHFIDEGFFLEVMPLFRMGHPRLFIPWTEITDRDESSTLFWKADQLVIGSPRVGTITLPSRLIEAHSP